MIEYFINWSITSINFVAVFFKEDLKVKRQRFTPMVEKINATAKCGFESIFVEFYKYNLARLIIYYADSIARLNGELDNYV